MAPAQMAKRRTNGVSANEQTALATAIITYLIIVDTDRHYFGR